MGWTSSRWILGGFCLALAGCGTRRGPNDTSSDADTGDADADTDTSSDADTGDVDTGADDTSSVQIPDVDIYVELTWITPGDPDETDEGPLAGTDLNLHFTHPFAVGGQGDLDGDGTSDPYYDSNFDCYWFNPSPNWASLDVAVDDDPVLEDDSDGAGPETLSLNSPEDGKTYRVAVHYLEDHDFGASLATVRVGIRGQVAYEVHDVELHELDMWCVATVDWPSGGVSLCEPPTGTGHWITPDYDVFGL